MDDAEDFYILHFTFFHILFVLESEVSGQDLVSQRSRGHRLCSGRGSQLVKKFFLLILLISKKIQFFWTKKSHFLGFLRVNKDHDEVLGPPSFTHGVPGYEKVTIKGARFISDRQGMPG